MLTCKYIKGDIDITKLTNKPASSNLWKGVASAVDILLKGTRRRIYNGLDTLFWRDTWLGDTPLLNVALRTISLVDSYKTVHEYWTPSEGWRWNLITGLLPPHIEDRLKAVLVRQDADNKDGTCWGLTSHG